MGEQPSHMSPLLGFSPPRNHCTFLSICCSLHALLLLVRPDCVVIIVAVTSKTRLYSNYRRQILKDNSLSRSRLGLGIGASPLAPKAFRPTSHLSKVSERTLRTDQDSASKEVSTLNP